MSLVSSEERYEVRNTDEREHSLGCILTMWALCEEKPGAPGCEPPSAYELSYDYLTVCLSDQGFGNLTKASG